MNLKHLLYSLFVLLSLSLTTSIGAHARHGMGMMGHMDDDDYREHMQGRGMMGGYGMRGGHGMMGGHGMTGGYGMMGGMGPVMMLDLNDKQRDEILAIQRDMQKQNWERMGEMMNLRHQLQDIMRSENPDPAAAGKVFDNMSTLHRQMFMEQIKTRNRVMNKLSKEQREQLRQHSGRGMMMQ